MARINRPRTDTQDAVLVALCILIIVSILGMFFYIGNPYQPSDSSYSCG